MESLNKNIYLLVPSKVVFTAGFELLEFRFTRFFGGRLTRVSLQKSTAEAILTRLGVVSVEFLIELMYFIWQKIVFFFPDVFEHREKG